MSLVGQLMKPVGPKAEAFAWDKRLITGIMGPVGSAKTTTCIRKMIHGALWQQPGADGIYRARWGVIRDTYPQLRKTALASWWQWFPKSMGQWSGDAPFEHSIRLKVFWGSTLRTVELTVIFAAIGENKVEDVLRGWELTGLWINEADLVARDVFTVGMGRIGRYPSANQGGCTWRGIIIDMNAPDIDNWTYEILVDQALNIDEETEAELRAELGELYGVGFYVQPGGRSKDPRPENVDNLPKGYYAQQILGMANDPHKIRRLVDNEFGPVRHGQPVYDSYNDEIHCAKAKLEPIKGVPIRIGTDAGLTPGAVIGQQDPATGQVRWLGEVAVFPEGEDALISQQLGAREFGRMVGRYIKAEFPFNELAEPVWCDPAGAAGEDAAAADPSWRQHFKAGLSEEMGRSIAVKAAPVKGNSLEIRLEAVRNPMNKLLPNGQPGFVICPVRCRLLRRGFKGGFIYRRTKFAEGSGGSFGYKPLKNEFSHVHEGGQYLNCGLARHGNGAGGDGHGDRRDGGAPRRRIKVDSSYNRFSGGKRR